jgi:hypothetical protein
MSLGIIVAVIVIIAVIGGIAFMVLKQEQGKGSLGTKIEIVNQPLLLDTDETLCITGSKSNNSVFIDTFIDNSDVEESENVKKISNDHQLWSGTSSDQIKRKNVNLCLDIAGSQFIEGAKIIQNPCSSNTVTQKWSFGNEQIKSKIKPNLCIDVNVIEKNQQLQLQSCNDSSKNQKWSTREENEE